MDYVLIQSGYKTLIDKFYKYDVKIFSLKTMNYLLFKNVHISIGDGLFKTEL